jgi:hypothetical protein
VARVRVSAARGDLIPSESRAEPSDRHPMDSGERRVVWQAMGRVSAVP